MTTLRRPATRPRPRHPPPSSPARALTPGGDRLPVRAFRAVGGTPRFMASGHGPWLTNVDGRDYGTDLVCAWGPMILGHAHPAVLDAVLEAAAHGFSFRTPSGNEVLLAEEIVARVAPVQRAAGLEQHRGDGKRHPPGPRLHRALAGREVRRPLPRTRRLPARPARRRRRLSASLQLGRRPPSMAAETLVVPYNDVAALEAVFTTPRRAHRLRHHRGRRGEHGRRPAGCRVHRGAAAGHAAHADAPRLRRGHDGLPGQPRGLVGPQDATSHRTSRTFGKVMGGASPPGLRRSRRRHGPPRAGRSGLPGRHAVGEPRGDRGRPRHAAGPATTP